MFSYVLIGMCAGGVTFLYSVSNGINLVVAFILSSAAVSLVTLLVPVVRLAASSVALAAFRTRDTTGGPTGEQPTQVTDLWQLNYERRSAAHIQALELELAHYVVKYGLTDEARRLLRPQPFVFRKKWYSSALERRDYAGQRELHH